MTVAENIAKVMESRGMNPSELARAAGINQTGVHDILSGRSRHPRHDTISKIAAALRVPLMELLETKDCRDLRQELLGAAAALFVEDQRRLLAIAVALARPAGQ